jgi:putative Holliday junction resolvase
VRVLALDLGESRIGVAVSDTSGILASPYAVVERSGDRRSDRVRISELVDETGAERVVVGLPLSLSGREGRAALAAREEIEALRLVLGIPVETVDERLTTVEAARRRRERLEPRVEPRRRGRTPRRLGRAGIDAEAAAILLAAWLDSHRGAG